MTRWIILASLLMALFAAPQIAEARDGHRGHGHHGWHGKHFHAKHFSHGRRHRSNDHVRINIIAPAGFGYYTPGYYHTHHAHCDHVAYYAPPPRPFLQRQVGWVPYY